MQQPQSGLGRRAQIVILDEATLPPSVVMRAPSFDHEIRLFKHTAPEDVAERIAIADIVITNKVPLNAMCIAGSRNLKLVAIAATGYDNVDLAACNAMGVTVSNIRQYATNTVPEHTFALLLALRRGLLPYDRSLKEGMWQESGQFCYFQWPIHDLAGSTLGIIGDGSIAQAVAAIGTAFHMRILFASYKGTRGMGPLYTPFEDVMRISDVITLHCPLLPSTHNLIGREEFSLMKQRPLLINTARGGLVDELALAEALDSGIIAGAAFDVATTEPPDSDHPLMKLVGRPNFILTPHVAWASVEAAQSLVDQLVENIELFWAGRSRNVVQ